MNKPMEHRMKVEEKIETKTVSDIELLTETVATLSVAVRTQNNLILCLLNKFDIGSDLPTQDKETFEKEMGEKVKACNEAIRKIYGRSETDKG